MGYGNMLPYLNCENSEQRRNWILRVRFGPLPPLHRHGSTEDLDENKLTVKGRTMNTFMRLPQIVNREISFHKRPFIYRKTDRVPSLSINALRRSADDLHLEGLQSRGRSRSKWAQREIDITAEHSSKSISRNTDVNLPKTAPAKTRRSSRRWSDGEPDFSHQVLAERIRPTTPTYERQPKFGSRSLSAIKSDSCVIQSADEILREFKEYSHRRDQLGDSVSTQSPRLKRETGISFTIPTEMSERHDQVNGTVSPTKDVNRKNRAPEKKNNKTRLLKQKRRILMPSGDSTGSRNSSTERLPGSGRSGSSTTLLSRTSSKVLNVNRRQSITRKLDTNNKNKKMTTNQSESPSVPSEEEIQEIQDVPVIRKFLKMPASRPKVVCFDYPGVDLTHMDVKRALEKVIPDAFESGKVVSIQFENANVKLATGGLDNRWFIELKDFSTRNMLIKNGLVIEKPGKNSVSDLKIKVPKRSDEAGTSVDEPEEDEDITFPPIDYPTKVEVKLNDVVAMEEYKLYLRRTAAEEKLQNVILLCAGRGDKLLTTMI